MVKNASSLSSDLDLIKEFEELKIKQKLLIESIKKKGNSPQEQLLIDINSKLDFLVKIFKEVNDNSESNDNFENLSNLVTGISEKFESLEKKYDEEFERLHKSLSEITIKLNTAQLKSNDNSSLNLPTAPDFKVSDKVEQISSSQNNENKEKKKRKWF